MNDNDVIRISLTWAELRQLASYASTHADIAEEMRLLDCILRDKLLRMHARDEYTRHLLDAQKGVN